MENQTEQPQVNEQVQEQSNKTHLNDLKPINVESLTKYLLDFSSENLAPLVIYNGNRKTINIIKEIEENNVRKLQKIEITVQEVEELCI